MGIRYVAIVREQGVYSGEIAQGRTRLPLLVSLTLLVVCVSTLLILGIVTAARAQNVPQLPDLPQAYLPGNPMPKDVSCYAPSGELIPRCSIDFGDHEAHFGVDPNWNIITHTLIPAREYSAGQMVADWGTPTGITRKETQVYVHWGARSALIYTHSFQPDSIVEFIQYDLEPLSASPWRGFGLFE